MVEAVLKWRIYPIRRRLRILYLQALDNVEICLDEKVRFVSKMKQRLRADSVGVMGGFDDRERERLFWYRYFEYLLVFWIFVEKGQ